MSLGFKRLTLHIHTSVPSVSDVVIVTKCHNWYLRYPFLHKIAVALCSEKTAESHCTWVYTVVGFIHFGILSLSICAVSVNLMQVSSSWPKALPLTCSSSRRHQLMPGVLLWQTRSTTV